jgi:hypothetical protein
MFGRRFGLEDPERPVEPTVQAHRATLRPSVHMRSARSRVLLRDQGYGCDPVSNQTRGSALPGAPERERLRRQLRELLRCVRRNRMYGATADTDAHHHTPADTDTHRLWRALPSG